MTNPTAESVAFNEYIRGRTEVVDAFAELAEQMRDDYPTAASEIEREIERLAEMK